MGRCLEGGDTRGTPAGLWVLHLVRVLCEAKSRWESRGSRGAGLSATESPVHSLPHSCSSTGQIPLPAARQTKAPSSPDPAVFILSRRVWVCSVALSCLTLWPPWTVAHWTPFSPWYHSSKSTGMGHHSYSVQTHVCVLSRSAVSDSLWPYGL